jgi:hypothetical protein
MTTSSATLSSNTAASPTATAGAPRVRDYQYYDVAISICSTCFRQVNGKIIFQDGSVFMLKRCPEHGNEKVLLADDIDYYRRAREVFLKPSEMPQRFATPVMYGCPYDCGLCTDHEQHSCVSLLEINDHCNLACPICYASSGPHRPEHKPLDQVLAMLDAIVRSEGEADVVQVSGGEPTTHPDFFAILDAAKERPIRHLMVNTNGLRIAKDPEFAERLATYLPGFELYLQFDSFERGTLEQLRGADLRGIRRQAVERLNELGISTTLVVTLSKGANDSECGKIVDWALQQPAIRGVTFQPIQQAGRTEGFDPARDRLTLTEVRRKIAEQSEHFRIEDLLPVPCHPDCIAMAYALKIGQQVTPLTGIVDPQLLIDSARNTIVFESDPDLKQSLFDILSTGHSPASGADSLRDLLCCLPQVDLPPHLDYRNVFRIIIMQFLDAHSFDVRSVKKSCVHVVHPDDYRMIPLDTYNLFYRGDLEKSRLAPLRRRVVR